MIQEIDILLVEDNLSDAEMTIAVLTENKLANMLFHVKNGAQALDFIFAEGQLLTAKLTINPRLSFST